MNTTTASLPGSAAAAPRAAPLAVSILVFDGVEALDFAGPFEVFTTATRVRTRQNPELPPLFRVQSVARENTPVRARAGLRLLPDTDFAAAPQADLLVVPGGVVDRAMTCPVTRAWVASQHPGTQITASVCTGAFVLAASGVLENGEATTHWEDQADLARQFPALTVRGGVRWVDQGHVVTSAGISAGIDMSLHLVARVGGRALAERTARQMEFEWTRA
ncbi:MAG: DJ-1/PfpI family protein [Hydrogenophaga sp.]|jgi:transcriptional regulator GlxA family with amidase domain|nr:DJ-1/PfpI family protein [Hydrogenophaga sp.]